MIEGLRESDSSFNQILNAIDAIGDYKPGSRKAPTSLNVSSISKASKDLIMSFPVLCDNSLSPTTAAMICKAIERKAVTMLQLIFASYSFNASSGRDVINQWHNNIDTGNMSVDDYIALCDDLAENCIDSPAERKAVTEAMYEIKAEMKAGDKCYPVSSFSETSIADFNVSTKYGELVVTEARNQSRGDIWDEKMKSANYQKARADIRNKNRQTDMYDKQMNQMDLDNARQKNKDDHQLAMDNQNYLQRMLMDNDAKKCNELVPSLMTVKFTDPNSKKENNFVAGVKARLIPMDSYEIIDRINVKGSMHGLLDFVRATTKEISFVKDYLLAIDKAKVEATRNSKRSNKSNSRIWKTLEKRSNKSVWKRLMGKANTAGAITSLVVSQEIVNILIKEYNVNITDIKTATKVMDSYNLLALVIVDESTEVARFLYDGDSSYEDVSFSSLERESGDGSYKKVINLLTKMNGR